MEKNGSCNTLQQQHARFPVVKLLNHFPPNCGRSWNLWHPGNRRDGDVADIKALRYSQQIMVHGERSCGKFNELFPAAR